MTRKKKKKIPQKQIYKYQIENIVKRLAEHPPCIHLSIKLTICAQNTNLGRRN